MNIENITSNEMNLSNNGRFMQIEIYEKEIKRLQQELQRKDNIIKQLKKHLEHEIEEWQDVSGEWIKAQVQEDKIILSKINELEGDNK